MPKKGTEVKQVWNSVEEIAKHFGVPQFQVRNVVEGRKKSTLGFRWMPVSVPKVSGDTKSKRN